jgi:hypothetical protein
LRIKIYHQAAFKAKSIGTVVSALNSSGDRVHNGGFTYAALVAVDTEDFVVVERHQKSNVFTVLKWLYKRRLTQS